MDTLYLFLVFGTINLTCVFAVSPSISMFFNDLPIENGGIYEYQSGTKLIVTCQADGDANGSSDSSNILNIVRSYNLPQNHESSPPNDKNRDEIIYEKGSVKEIRHTFELTPGENGVRITCARKNNVGVSTFLIMKVENFDSTSFGKGIAVGVAITIFLGFLCWLIVSFYQTRQRPRIATPPSESDYASVYAWRKPLKHSSPPLPSHPPPDVLKTLQNFRFPLKPAPSQPPPTNALPNLRYPLEQSLPPPGITQTPPNLRFPQQSLPKPLPDVTQAVKPPQSSELNIQNLQLPPKPSLSGSGPSDIPRSRQICVSAMQMAKLQAVMGTK